MDYETPFVGRCTGAEFVAFFSDKSIWPDGRFLTQMDCWINDKDMPEGMRISSIPPDAVVEFSDQCEVLDDDSTFVGTDLVTYFNRWRLAKQGVLAEAVA